MKTSFRLSILIGLCCFYLIDLHGQNGDSWEKILNARKGTVNFHWFPNNTQIDQSKDVMDGVEHELCNDMIDFLEEKYDLQIEINWEKAQGFSELLEMITNGSGGTFGVSSISVTGPRKEVLNFSPSYFPDISVLVSSGNIPIVRSEQQLIGTINGLTAVTIENTTLEMALLKLKDSLKLDFDIIYVDNGGAIIEKVEELEDAFGYADLPNFLSALPRSPNIKRQVFFPLKLEGLAMVFPQESDWSDAVSEYFSSPRYERKRHSLIERYMGSNVDQLIERISKSAEIGPEEEIAILAEEVELRYKEQLDAALDAQENQKIRNVLLIGVVAFVLIAILLYSRARIKTKANIALAEQQDLIEKRNRQLQELDQDKNNLIQVLAHDLRGPISQIMGFSRLMQEGDSLSAEDREMIEYIDQSSGRLHKMIGKVLDINAIESGNRNVNLQPLDIGDVVGKVVEEISKQADKKRIKIQYEHQAGFMAMADKVYLPQVLENLISNAIKFSQPTTKVDVGVETENEFILISVKDEGPGFSKDDQRKIFKKYQNLSAKPTAGEPSTGLGLSIIKSYVDMMKGEISFATEPGKGTTFFVRLNAT